MGETASAVAVTASYSGSAEVGAVAASVKPVIAPNAVTVARRSSALSKRVFETALALLLLLVLLPAMLLVAGAILVTSGRPVLFRQPRIGQAGRRFRILKFRTFPVDHVDDVHSRPIADCPTVLGRFLRRTSLDETPQLLNVLKGDMSLVGPRPERPHFVEFLATDIPAYERRHRVPGGITGLAQVSGYWGDSDVAERVRLDNEYIEHWTFSRDLSILARTLPAVVRKARR
jgi:lipopolysaccharide/colanic/teichoic acid biosynthesis glycosyltransferase